MFKLYNFAAYQLAWFAVILGAAHGHAWAGTAVALLVTVAHLWMRREPLELKLVGVAATERHFMAPDVPTFREQGFDVVVGSWRCIIAPKGIPADRLAFLESNILATLKDPEFLASAKKAGFIIQPLDSKATYKRWKDDDAALYPILLEAGLVKARQK